MALAKDVYVKCDECDAIEAMTASKNAKTARQEAKRQGWKRINGRDICPRCQKNSR